MMNTRLPLPKHWSLAAADWGNKKDRRKDANGGFVMGVLIWNEESGEGEVLLQQSFPKRGWVTQADALNDWIGLLKRHYEAMLESQK